MASTHSSSPAPGSQPERLIIATRESRLAVWQAEHVQQRLKSLYPKCRVELLPMTTRGDELQEAKLATEGGKGLFIKELEVALTDGRADLAVHSMKDMPLRRASQVLERFPGVEIRPIRGNVNTRLAKLDRGEYAAIVLAASGLKRLGLESRIRSYLSVEQCLPSAGQGALGIECRADRADLIAAVAPLVHAGSSICVRAERAVNRALGGNCSIPLGAYAESWAGTLRLRALVSSPDATRIARAEATGPADNPEALGEKVAELLRERGAAEILAALDA
ncbi:MAG: hydroxymethylbilane synthase [Betaproteobacteria bacterium]|nr:hydroxymethylbilane synthase [Betaproteobacteria bacterium]